MRARLAIQAAAQEVELREVLLRDKATEFLETSPSATVPCLKDGETVLDESLEIMIWALERNDPAGWLLVPRSGRDVITEADGSFKQALDRTKYHTRYDSDPEAERARAGVFLAKLDTQLAGKAWLYGDNPSIADMAILPFVRQFAFIDKPRFDAEPWPHLQRWLEAFLASQDFERIMLKYQVWQSKDPATVFPTDSA
ncbi:Glutathione S-transferase domain protein [Candidatus Rhodobacter oscarellae]|uniref:Glutathione S-transferase domain protein n=2 Tax=Candidatus Rhodobacter oscarellae TaxID=1675527 RepID=A0A0J9ECD0_9RHOB|nr:Glutathione S-transferase domain protein [Candidatus Rhodobacter lobularis]